MPYVTDFLRSELSALLGPRQVIGAGDSLDALSQDFYWYSPVLKRQLADRRAELAVRPGTAAELEGVVAACFRAGVPLVARGAGTGNYGQCVPLYGGVVVDLSGLNRLHSLAAGVVRAEPGVRLGTIETAARAAGWELRCMPSTWMKSSLGGFLCGGSGGIGSIRWGGINAADTIKSVTLLSCAAAPARQRLEERAALPALHTYGTTGLMVEIEMRLAPKVDYEQVIVGGADWETVLTWTDAAARQSDWPKRLVAQFEWPIPSYFAPLRRHFRAGDHVSFLLVARAAADALLASARAAGLTCVYRRPLADPPQPPFITDFTWNHTTLWAIRTDPSITYLQAGFGDDFRRQFAGLRRRFPGEILLHLEWTAGNAKFLRDGAEGGSVPPNAIGVGGIPLVFFRSEDRLREILEACADLGIGIANPHTYVLEEGGRHPHLAAKRDLKHSLDAAGLLNPGKMQTFPLNPFAARRAGG